MMASENSDQTPKKVDPSPFDGIMKIVNDFFYESPMKGFFESFDDLLKKPLIGATIPIDAYETKDEYIIEAELPGINREQIQLDVNSHYITITVQNTETINQLNEKDEIYHKSHSYQHLKRTIPLPYQVLESQIKASFKNGLLQIRFPGQKKKRIEIE